VTERFWFNEHGELPVLSRDDPPRFLGVVTRRDVLRAFDREVLQRKLLTVRYDPEHPEKSPRRSMVDLPVEFTIQEIPVPQAFEGKTLSEIDLPHRFLLTALALKPADGTQREIIPPPADRELSRDDRLVLVGKRGDLARFVRA
jgi:hypothetical protein